MFRGIRLLAILVALSLFSRVALAANENIPWVLNGSAVANALGQIYLTRNLNEAGPAGAGGAGGEHSSMWNPCQINLTSDFDLTFDVNLGDRSCGADGIAFVLQPDGTNMCGGNSGLHAYDGIDHSIAVQFDTWANTVPPYNDPVYDSIGLQENGAADSIIPSNCGGPAGVTGTCGRPQILAGALDAKDGADHAVEIAWTAATHTLAVTVDGSLRASWSFTAAAFNAVFTTGTNVWYGFTGATGGSFNYQAVAQTSSNPCASAWSTPVPPVPAPTALVVPTNDCGTPTDIPTFTFSPTVTTTPTVTPTFTQTSTPYPAGCGTPVFESAANVGGGCLNGTPNTFSVTAPLVANTLMLVRLENGAAPSNATSITYNGSPFTFIGTIPGYSGNMSAYYLVAPAAGTHNLVINGIAGCGWNVIYEIYSGVDQVTPIGAVASGTGAAPSNPYNVPAIITTNGPASLVSDYLQTDNLTPADGPGQVSLGVASNCCDTVFADYMDVGGAGTYTLTYVYTQTGKQYTYHAIEIRGAASCFSPTPSPIVSPTDTPTASPTASSTHTPPPTATPTVTRTPTNTRTATPQPLLLTPHHPNPDPAGGDGVWLPFTITTDAKIHIKVYDISGELIVDAATVPYASGNQEWHWDLLNTAKRRSSSGIYLCRIQADAAGGQTQVVWEKCSVLH